MTSPAEMQAQIDALTLELRDLREQVPGAIAEGLRTFADRPAGEKGAPSLQYGIVDGVFDADGWASVLLDGQTEPVPIMMLGGLVEGERVAVLLVPPSGSLAIGMVTPTVVPGVANRVSDYYNIGSPVSTNIPNATLANLEWPTLTAGPGILDLSDPTIPLTLYAGEYAVTATVVLGAGELTGGNAGEYILAILDIADPSAPFFSETATTLMGLSAADDEYRSLTLNAVVSAGSGIQIRAFNVDTGITVTVKVTEVVVTGPSA